MAGELKCPPAGVATSPTGNDAYVPLKVAAERLHMDPRTVQAAVVSGEIRGWARRGPQRLRWFVYADQLPTSSRVGADPSSVADLRRELADLTEKVIPALRAEIEQLKQAATADVRTEARRLVDSAIADLQADASRVRETTMADLRAENVALTEANLLLIEAHDDLGKVTTALDSAARRYRRALALFMTPGHPGELTGGS